MSQRVPSWDIDDPPNPPPSSLLVHHHHSAAPHVPMPDNEVAELTWENGRLSMHGLTYSRIGKPTPKYRSPGPAGVFDKLRPSGTLESVVDQATRAQRHPSSPFLHPGLSAWLSGQHHHAAPCDAVVPSSSHAHTDARPDPVPDPSSGIVGSSGVGVGRGRKRARVAEARQGSAGRGESTRVTLDTCDEVGLTHTSASPSLREEEEGGSPDTDNTSFGGTVDEHDSVGPSRPSQSDRAGDEVPQPRKEGGTERSTVSTKRSRAAAVHNQSERKRRDRINQRMRTLQKLVPSSSKTDKASMLDEVIEHLKQLQAQVQLMSRMGGIPHMMMPMSMQQLQLSMMAQMAHMTQMAQMGMGMVDIGALSRAGNAGMGPVLPPSGVPPVFSPAAFLPITGAPPRDASCERLQPPSGTMFPDPLAPMLACPTQATGMDAYNRMAALYQQLCQQNAGTNLNC